MTVFYPNKNDQLKEPMFFGTPVNVARFDQQKYKIFDDLSEKQLSFFWRPQEVDVSQDRIDFNEKLTDAEKHIFLSNLKYQTLLDSVQGRSPTMAFLPIVSLPELENWIETWAFSETIHSRSYTHIIRNVVNNPSLIFDDIVTNEYIKNRTTSVTEYYDELIGLSEDYRCGYELVSRHELKQKLYLCMMSVNVLEAIRFYVSFACSFAFAERELMEGNAKIIKLIARDEALHQSGTQHIIKLFNTGMDDMEMAEIAEECREESIEIFRSAAKQEKEWAKYLFTEGGMIGLNEDILCQYIDYITDLRMKYVGLPPINGGNVQNPIPWINNWLTSDNVQVAPQEVEVSSYLTASIDTEVDNDEFGDFEL